MPIRTFAPPLAAAALVALAAGPAAGAVDILVVQNTEVGGIPLATESSPDGERLFVLTDRGEVVILSSSGEIKGRVDVGPGFTTLSYQARGDRLVLGSPAGKSVRIVQLDYVNTFSMNGSPVKGAPGGKVVLVVFSDFQ